MTFYQWNKNGQTGSWNDPSNWTPTGIPGSSDGAEIGDTFFASSQTVTGTGTAATLETAGNTTLAGTFAVSGNLIVDIGLYQPTLTVQFGLLTVDGGPLTIGGALSPGLGLVAKNGAVVTASNLSTMDENCKIDVDASSAIEIGGSGGVAPGQLAIDRGININLTADSFEINHRSPTNARLAALTVVNNGTIASIKNDDPKFWKYKLRLWSITAPLRLPMASFKFRLWLT